MQAVSTIERRGYLELPLRRLQALSVLSAEEQAAVRGLQSIRVKRLKGETLVQAGSEPHFILEGWGCQMREVPPGRRQIFAFVLPGDAIGHLPHDTAEEGRFVYKALTPVTMVGAGVLLEISRDGAARAPGVRAALAAFRDTARSRLFDHVVRLGAHTAYEGTAHLLLELNDRMAQVGLAQEGRFAFPIGQERLGEMLGLSGVHVHRTLAKLKQDGHLLAGPGWFALPRRRELAQAVGYVAQAELHVRVPPE
jgi:CRP-like cAMP-binding protein